MDHKLNPLLFAFAAGVITLALLSASVLLPHDRYFRFQAHDNITTRKADWIYERLHFDPTPIDVALIGTSRTAGGLSGPLIEKRYCESLGRRIHVANLAIPVTGRNMHYFIAKEAQKTKAPALTVIELNDVESRKPHPGFIFLADARDIVTAPIAINKNYLSDIIRLPGRQFSLFLQTIFNRPAVRAQFDPENYAGPNLDLTEVQIALDGRIKSRRVVHSAAHMNALRAKRLADTLPLYVAPVGFKALEYRYPRTYLHKVERAATRAGNTVAYAYLPAYGESAIAPELLRALEIDEPFIDLGGAAATDENLWLDATHFNAAGATDASERFAAALIEEHPQLGRSGACH